MAAAPGGILSIPAQKVSLGSPRVGTIHVQAPTPHTPPLQSFLVDFAAPADHGRGLRGQVLQGGIADCRIDGVCGAGAYPQSDLPREAARSRSPPKKVTNLDPMAYAFPSKTSITRGPPVVAVAVSLDPILPQR